MPLPSSTVESVNPDSFPNESFCPYYIILAIFLFVLIFVIIHLRNNDDCKYEYCRHKDKFMNYAIGANTYKVYETLVDPQLAATELDKLNRIAKRLIYYLNDKYINHNDGYNSIKPQYRDRVLSGIRDLTNNYKTNTLQENIPTATDKDTSYVIDKGDAFAMCVRDTKNNNIVPTDGWNERVFVMVHEMSHLFTKAFGHDMEFWTNFKFLLGETTKMGMYTPVNYKITNMPYCSIQISYSPLFDKDLVSYLV